MARDTKPVAKPTATAKPAAEAKGTNGSPVQAAPAPKKKEPKRAKVRLVSTTIPGLWVRAFCDVVEKYGVPLDPNGVKMIPGMAPRGLTAEQRLARQQQKEAEKARLANMSDDEKLAYARERREERQAQRAAKKQAERNALIAEIKAQIAAGEL